MNARTMFAALALAGALAAPVAAGQTTSKEPGRTVSEGPVTATEALEALAAERDVLEGVVAALDYENGQMIIDTDAGLFAFSTDPVDLTDVHIGDVIRVSLVQDDRD